MQLAYKTRPLLERNSRVRHRIVPVLSCRSEYRSTKVRDSSDNICLIGAQKDMLSIQTPAITGPF